MPIQFPSFSRGASLMLLLAALFLFTALAPKLAGTPAPALLGAALQWLLSLEARLDQFHGRSLLLLSAVLVWLSGIRLWCEHLLRDGQRSAPIRREWMRGQMFYAGLKYAFFSSVVLALFAGVVASAMFSEMHQWVFPRETLPDVAANASALFWASVFLTAALFWPKAYPASMVTRFGFERVLDADVSAASRYSLRSNQGTCSTIDLPLLTMRLAYQASPD